MKSIGLRFQRARRLLGVALLGLCALGWGSRTSAVQDPTPNPNIEKLLATRACRGCDFTNTTIVNKDLSGVDLTGATFNGHNASVWRDDLIRVNGFDERLEYGGLDRELGERLENAGVRGVQLRHRALVVHLDHPRGYRRTEAMARNRAIRDEVAAGRIARTPAGLDRHLASASGPARSAR